MPTADLPEGEWATVSLDVATPQRIGIRAQKVFIDNFTATTAQIEAEKSIVIATAEPSATTGTIYWNQQPDGTVLVKYTVTVTNNGECDLAVGDDGYSVSIINGTTGDVIATTPVPEALAKGQTSQPFDVQANVATDLWPYSWSGIKMNLKENLQGSITERAQSMYKAYASKFTFRKQGETKSVMSYAFGPVSEPATVAFEIYNDGVAPLELQSVTLPDGFTSADAFTAPLTLAGEQSQTLTVTLPVDVKGAKDGNLTVLYKEYGSDDVSTFTLHLTANVISANTWTADFNSTEKGITYPAGSVADAGISDDDYTFAGDAYDYYIYTGPYTTSSNRFITPLLHAEAGDALTYDAKYERYSGDRSLKVYATTDRNTLGEPIATLSKTDIQSAWETHTVTLPEAGDYYLVFELVGTCLDNLIGLEKVTVPYDLMVKSVSQPEETQSGQQMTATIEVQPLTDEAATDYTLTYTLGDNVYNIESVDLTASAKKTQTFTIDLTPTVETTQTLQSFFTFTFGTQGTIASPAKDIKVTNEAELVFLNRDERVGSYRPTSRTTPIAFGTTNEAGAKQQFDIYNYGTLPLSITSITLPDGFTASIHEATVAPKERAQLDITLSATEPDTYQGNLDIAYGPDQHFTLPVSATLLDPNKWYANFNDGDYAPGSVVQKNISLGNTGSYTDPDYCLNAYGTSANVFITPLLHAEAGDQIQYDAKLYSSSWPEGAVTVVCGKTRDEVLDATQRTVLATVSGQGDDPQLTTDYKTFTATIPEAGDYYLGFVIDNRAYVDNLYGLKLVSVPCDVQLAAYSVPAEVMQNALTTASISVRNIGLSTIYGPDYTVRAIVNGHTIEQLGTDSIAATHRLDNDEVALPIAFRIPTVGTASVQLQFECGDLTLTTDAVSVNVSAEVASSEKQIGTFSTYNSGSPLYLYYKNSETITLYTPDELALDDGAKINSITYKGYSSDPYTTHVKLYYQLTDATTEAEPATSGNFDTTGMTLAYDQDYAWPQAGSYGESAELLTVRFAEPIVYEAGKSLRVFITSSTDGYKSGFNFEQSETTGHAYTHANDGTAGEFTGSWSAKNSAVIYLGLEAQTATLSGQVTDHDGQPAVGATVTLTSTDGDGVQYTATTDAAGHYEVAVIQTARTYDALATDGHYDGTATGLTFAESQTQDFTLDTATAIDGLHAPAADHIIYNVSGQRLQRAHRGINIVNGRKLIVK